MKCLQLRWFPVLGSLSLAVASAWAAPEDDFKRGQESYNRGDVVAAMSALRPAAAAGHAPAQVLLAHILEKADFLEEAIVLYRDAAALGHPEGHVGLASALVSGQGIAKDEKLAVHHFSKAAEAGHARAIELLADAYLAGSMGLADAPAQALVVAVRRAADIGHLPSAEAMLSGYRAGRWGLPKDDAQAQEWARKVAELKAKRAGTQGKKKGSK